MTTPSTLVVAAPTLGFKPILGTCAPIEEAVKLSFAPVLFPDGSVMTADDYAAADALLTRTLTAGASGEVWDPASKTWKPLGSVELGAVHGIPLLPPPSSGSPWEGMLALAGQKDAGGAPLVSPAAAHFPRYHLRGLFRAKRGTTEAFGLGPESAPLEFATGTASRFAAELTPDPESPSRVRVVLRSAGLQSLGMIEVDASGAGVVVRLANFDAAGAPVASVTLEADGSIRLSPAAGRKVIVAADLEAERILYRPSGGSPKQYLDT